MATEIELRNLYNNADMKNITDQCIDGFSGYAIMKRHEKTPKGRNMIPPPEFSVFAMPYDRIEKKAEPRCNANNRYQKDKPQ